MVKQRPQKRWQAAAAAGAAVPGPTPPAPHAQRKLAKRVKFLEQVKKSALAVRGGVGKKKSSALELAALRDALSAVPAPRHVSPLFAPSAAKTPTAKARQRLVANELPRFAAVMQQPAFQADPIAAVCNHVMAALGAGAPPAPEAARPRPAKPKAKAAAAPQRAAQPPPREQGEKKRRPLGGARRRR